MNLRSYVARLANSVGHTLAKIRFAAIANSEYAGDIGFELLPILLAGNDEAVFVIDHVIDELSVWSCSPTIEKFIGY